MSERGRSNLRSTARSREERDECPAWECGDGVETGGWLEGGGGWVGE